MKKPILVILAAGMGSRYGGLKQIDAVGNHGEAILDFSLYDAHAAGFETAVIIIKESIRQDFMDTVGKRLEKCPMQIRYAYQELEDLPEGFTVPENRTRPWGTSHAVLCAEKQIDGAPFAVINADDYYGKDAFRVVFDYLADLQQEDAGRYCMVGYQLGNTVTDHGSVTRGVCVTSEDGYLVDIAERTRIEKYPGGIHFTTDDGATWEDLAPETPVSMNLWGYTPDFLAEIRSHFGAFLRDVLPANPLRAEFFLPLMVSTLLAEKKVTVKVLQSSDKWYGVTYAADKPAVAAAMSAMTAEGKYPDGLWA